MIRFSARTLFSAALLGSTALAAGGIATPAWAQPAEAEHSYDIAPGELAKALNQFASQSGVQITYEADLTARTVRSLSAGTPGNGLASVTAPSSRGEKRKVSPCPTKRNSVCNK